MNELPRFEVGRLWADGTVEQPEVVPLRAVPADVRLGRRALFGAGLTAGAAVAALGCAPGRLAAGKPSVEWPEECHANRAHRGAVEWTAFRSADTLLSLGEDGLKRWSIPAGAHLGTVAIEKSLTFPEALLLPDGDVLLVHGDGKTVRLAADGSRQEIGNALKEMRSPLAMSARWHLASLTEDGARFIVTDFRSGQRMWARPFKRAAGAMADEFVSFSADGRRVAIPDGDYVRALDADDGRILMTVEAYSARGAGFSPDGGLLAVLDCPKPCLGDMRLRVLRLSDGGEEMSVPAKDGSAVQFAGPDALLVATIDGTLLVSASSGRQLATYKTRGVTASPAGDVLAWGSTGGELFVLRTGDEQPRCLLDLASVSSGVKGARYERRVAGATVTEVVPCGAPIPSGATCTCNCVAGTYDPFKAIPSMCACNKVCTCVPVYR